MSSLNISPSVPKVRSEALSKAPTGIQGLDEITLGGLPRGRTTLICGGPGCGKTLLGMEFLVRGAAEFDEPGVCISFDETAEELAQNVASLGFPVDDLVAAGKLAIDYIYIERSLIEEAGEYDLEGLFVRLGLAVQSIGAKRVLLDSVETLFAGLSNEALLRSELRRLFRWLKDHGLTAIVTAERGSSSLTRHGLEEYISDCVILLDHRVAESVFTRRLRIVKYRGSTHSTNEFPFLIDEDGFSVVPVTSLGLKHTVSDERISSGIPALDAMLGGQGYYRGSSVMISGKAGTGKTSMASHFANATCARGERCIYFAFEESEPQVVRNMRSIGIDLGRWIAQGLLQFHATRPTTLGVEMHLLTMHSAIRRFDPAVAVIDPATSMLNIAEQSETKNMVLRIVDFLKSRQITTLLTTLTEGGGTPEQSGLSISSLVDAWLVLQEIENSGERNRGIHVLKTRGTAHSNQIREFLLTSHGVELRDVYLGADGIMLMGSARAAQEAKDEAAAESLAREVENQRILRERKRRALQAQIAALEAELAWETNESRRLTEQQQLENQLAARQRAAIAKSRTLNVGDAEDNQMNRGGAA
jgi:circadian clock protein KaiC